MCVLALDCSTARGSVALGRVTESAPAIIWRADFPAGRGCGGQMFTALQDALDAAKAADGRLEGIEVGLGPGSYSGVRQAIAAATGLALATGGWLRGAPSVLALGTGPFHAVGDGRRGTFYYTAVSEGICQRGPELLADAAELAKRLAAQPAWPVYVTESALPGGALPHADVRLPSAERLLGLPPAAYQLPPLEPIYLRPVNVTLPPPVKATAP